MKRAGLITNASKDVKEETIIFDVAAMAGTATYRLGNMAFVFDFDTCNIAPVGLTAEQFTWDPSDDDLVAHELDFGIYLSGRI